MLLHTLVASPVQRASKAGLVRKGFWHAHAENACWQRLCCAFWHLLLDPWEEHLHMTHNPLPSIPLTTAVTHTS